MDLCFVTSLINTYISNRLMHDKMNLQPYITPFVSGKTILSVLVNFRLKKVPTFIKSAHFDANYI